MQIRVCLAQTALARLNKRHSDQGVQPQLSRRSCCKSGGVTRLTELNAVTVRSIWYIYASIFFLRPFHFPSISLNRVSNRAKKNIPSPSLCTQTQRHNHHMANSPLWMLYGGVKYHKELAEGGLVSRVDLCHDSGHVKHDSSSARDWSIPFPWLQNWMFNSSSSRLAVPRE